MGRTAARLHRRQILQGSLALAYLGLLSGSGCGRLGFSPSLQVHRIGLLAPDSPASNPAAGALDAAFLEGLRAVGYVDGQNLTIEYRSAELRMERLPELATELVRLPVELIVAR